jgi:hypothetical protein
MTMHENNALSLLQATEIAAPPVELLAERRAGQWVSAPELVALLGLCHIAEGICRAVRGRLLAEKAAKAGGVRYSDASIFMTALIMRIFQLSLGQISLWLAHYPALALSCGYCPSRTISKSHLSRRLRALGPFPFLLYLLYSGHLLIEKGVIIGQDLIVDSTTVLAWCKQDIEAAYSFAKKFGYKIHTLICRHGRLPLFFFVTPANRHDGLFGPLLLQAVVRLYGISVKVVRADAAYFTGAFLALIASLGARHAVDYNVRRKNKALVPCAFIVWHKRRMKKRATIERFFGIAKVWFGLNAFHGQGYKAFLMHTLLTYCAILSVALLAVRVGQPDLRLSPRRLLAPC